MQSIRFEEKRSMGWFSIELNFNLIRSINILIFVVNVFDTKNIRLQRAKDILGQLVLNIIVESTSVFLYSHFDHNCGVSNTLQVTHTTFVSFTADFITDSYRVGGISNCW